MLYMIGHHHQTTCFFSKKFSYVCFNSNVSVYKSNLYIDPAMNIIGPSTHVRDLGVSMSSNCTFDFHIPNLYKWFCFTKLLTVWHKCPSKTSLSRRIRVLEENTAWNLDRLAIQLANMDSRFSLKLLVHGIDLLSLKLHNWLYLDQIVFKISVHPFHIIP